MRIALLTNAAAGRGTEPDRVAALLRESGASVTVHPFDPERSERAVEAAATEALEAAPDRLAVAGGDGSI
ncbi:MAG TPA: diacylglycerol kinase family protein, partial [Solirubrobacteraceae bacterium]|nr:diacylglycerol kinase family protein [Solirubrobacteraceae bacterium]